MESFNNLSSENIERSIRRYSYCNIDIPGRPLIFECEANSQEEADNLFIKKFGKDPKEEPHISRGSVSV